MPSRGVRSGFPEKFFSSSAKRPGYWFPATLSSTSFFTSLSSWLKPHSSFSARRTILQECLLPGEDRVRETVKDMEVHSRREFGSETCSGSIREQSYPGSEMIV